MAIISLSGVFTRFFSALAARPERLRAAFLAVLAVVIAATTIQYIAKVAKPAETGQQSRSAFLRWRTMILDVFTGTNIYVGKNEYPNPPVMAIVLRPFAELPPVAGALAWFFAKVLMAAVAIAWTFRLVTNTVESHAVSDLAKAAAILLALPALLGDLTHNNINILILFLVAGCLDLYRREHDLAAGIVLALAIACKVTPLLFLAYFSWKGAWKVVAACSVGLVLWLLLVPGIVFGWQHNRQLLDDWSQLMIVRPLVKGEVTTEHPNQAIPGVVYRLFTHSPSFIAYEKTPAGDIPVPAAYHNIAELGRPTAWFAVKAAMAAFIVAVIVLCRAPRTERHGWRFTAECGLIVLGMLLFSERTWKHHAVTLVIPAAALGCAVAGGLTRAMRNYVLAAMTLSGLLIVAPGLLGRRVQDLALIYGTHTCAFLLLTSGVCLILAHGLRGWHRSERRIKRVKPT